MEGVSDVFIDSDTILLAAELIGAIGIIIGLIISIYKNVERNKQQSVEIRSIQAEQQIICYGILACLKGLREQGCNGPVTEALNKIEKHLNQAAHHHGEE